MGARRPTFERGIYHVTQRATDREILFRDDEDYSRMLRTLECTARRYDFVVEDYCLMPNHVHLLLRIRRPNLPALMQYLFARHVAWFNSRHLRRGHLVGAPYRVAAIADEAHLVRVRRYLALNPMKAGLCSHPLEWPWCAFSGDGSVAPRPSRAVVELVAQAVGTRRAA